MKSLFKFSGLLCACVMGASAFAVSAGTVAGNSNGAARGLTTVNTNPVSVGNTLRGNQGLVNAYKTNQRNTYYMVNVPDVDSACRVKIDNCLAEYCGDITVVPGQVSGRCAYATETELYNYVMLCLRNDRSVLLPNYATNTKMGAGGVNTAAHLCPYYVQQELMAWMSMANMSNELTKAHSPQCLKRRQELEAAMSCHSVALAYGNETSSMLMSQLNDFCGAGVAGGSAEMVSRFANAGNVGANIWGWAEKIVTLDMNKKAEDWEVAVDAVLASYTNRMNLACGDDVQLNLPQRTTSSGPTAVQAVATVAAAAAFPDTQKKTNSVTPDLFFEVTSRQEIYKWETARDVIQAGLGNSVLTQNAFFTPDQMDQMQKAYKKGTNLFILRDSTRCFFVPVDEMTDAEKSMVATQFSTCIYK